VDLASALQATHAQPQASFQGEALCFAKCGRDKRLLWAAIEMFTDSQVRCLRLSLSITFPDSAGFNILVANVVVLIGSHSPETACSSHTSLLSMYSLLQSNRETKPISTGRHFHRSFINIQHSSPVHQIALCLSTPSFYCAFSDSQGKHRISSSSSSVSPTTHKRSSAGSPIAQEEAA